MAKKAISLNFADDVIVYTNINKSRNGYNEARLVAKIEDGIYISVSIEWKDDNGIPEFAMDVMKFMQANEEELKVRAEDHKEEIAKLI